MTSILKVDSIQTSAGKPIVNATGSVLQVVSTTKTDTFSTSSDSFIDVTGFSVSITPSSSSSKILVSVSASGNGSSAAARLEGRLVRDSTPIFVGDSAGSRGQASFEMYKNDNGGLDSSSVNFLDAPATTSSITYKIQIRDNNSSASSVFINRSETDSNDSVYNRYASTITVMEIAG